MMPVPKTKSWAISENMEMLSKKERDRARYLRNRELFLERAREWRKKNPDRAKENRKRSWADLKADPLRYERYLNAASNRQRRLKIRVLEYYCQGVPHCECCGVQEMEFLTLDHIHGKGNVHRREVGSNLYKWAAANNFPDEIFRVLCMNCNLSWGHYGYCPHAANDN